MKSKKPLPKGAAKSSSTKKSKPAVAKAANQVKGELNDRQKLFVAEYLIDLNATQAAIRAGYSRKTAGQIGDENLKKPQIAAAVQAGMDARAKRTEITADNVLKQLGKMVFFDIRTLFDEHGGLKPVRELDDTAAAAIVSVESDELFDGHGKARKFVGYSRKVKIADRVGSMQLAMRHLKMLTDKSEHSGPEGGPIPVATTAVEYSSLRDKLTPFAGATAG